MFPQMGSIVDKNIERVMLSPKLDNLSRVRLAHDLNRYLVIFKLFTIMVDVCSDNLGVLEIFLPHSNRSPRRNANLKKFYSVIATSLQKFFIKNQIIMVN